jgi:hypothetical protein
LVPYPIYFGYPEFYIVLRINWRTVAAIVGRVVAHGRDTNDLLSGLVRIGIDGAI